MQLRVSLDFGHTKLFVGTLALEQERYYFKFSDAFLQSGLELSPLKMPTSLDVLTGPDHVFEG